MIVLTAIICLQVPLWLYKITMALLCVLVLVFILLQYRLRKQKEELKLRNLRLADSLRESNNKLNRVLNNMLSGFVVYEPVFEDSRLIDVRFVETNDAFFEQTGIRPEEVINKTYSEVFGDSIKLFIDSYNTYIETGKYINYEQYIEALKKYFRVQLFEYIPGQMAIILDDVTETKQMEHKLIETVVNIEERGHRRIARDLHDELGPQLASMNVYTSSLLRKIEQPEQREILLILKDLIKASIARVREISNNLTPNVIEKYGLIPAINTEIENMRLILPVSFKHTCQEVRFDPKIEISVYRIVKELLNNTKKYANATEVEIELCKGPNALTLAYSDNGIGFNLEENLKSGDVGMGLLNIESRVKAIRGKSLMKSKPNEGFKFYLDVPVNPNNEV